MTTAEAPAAVCRHHYVLESPNGPISIGRCKFCRAVRDDFRNTPADSLWADGDRESIKKSMVKGQMNQARNGFNASLGPKTEPTHVFSVKAHPTRTRKPTVREPKPKAVRAPKPPKAPREPKPAKVKLPREKPPLNVNQSDLLAYIAAHKDCRAKDLAEAIDCDTASVVKRLNKLVNRGLINRVKPRTYPNWATYHIRDEMSGYREELDEFNPEQRAYIDFVNAHPGSQCFDLQQEFGHSKGCAHSRLRTLVNTGQIVKTQIGRSAYYGPNKKTSGEGSTDATQSPPAASAELTASLISKALEVVRMEEG